MCAQYSDLQCYTHAQLRQYTHEQLEALSLDELLELAQIKVDQADKLPDEKKAPFERLISAAKEFLLEYGKKLIIDVAVDTTLNTVWKPVLRAIIEFFQSILNL